jgi:sulfite exporter TauE/SafE
MDFVWTQLGAAAAAGLVSSTHCAAMCGPLAATTCGRSDRHAVRPALSYMGGRFVSYGIVGALAGAFGSGLVRSIGTEHVHQVAAVGVAAGLVLAAVRMLRAAPPAPELVPLRRAREEARPVMVRPSSARGLLVGLATGLLPCGALATGLLLAASTTSAWAGSLVMLAFALASAPGLLAVVMAGNLLQRFGDRFGSGVRRRAFGVVLVCAAAWIAARPWLYPPRRCHCHTSQAPIAARAGTG